MQNTVLGVLAHVDAGKTTLSEQLLFCGGALRTLGQVDRQSAFLDHAEIERRRGITVFSDQAELEINGRPFTLIDTPGHVDFAGEMERSLSVLDCAVLVVSCAEGVQAHTETLWGLLREKEIPTILFLNKTDRDGANVAQTMAQLERLGGKSFLLLPPVGALREEEKEFLAGLEDSLTERYLGDRSEEISWEREIQALVGARKLFPVYTGSALRGIGIEDLMDGLESYAPLRDRTESAPFSGRVYQVRHEKGMRVVRLKVEQGTLHAKDRIRLPGGEEEKCDELRKYNSEKFAPLTEAKPGMVCAVTGLTTVHPGDLIGEAAGEAPPFTLRPLLSSQVIWRDGTPASQMLADFRELEDEEPLLGVEWNEEAQEISVHIMGEVQLEVLAELLKERFRKEISFGPCSVLYAETITAPVVGCGHYEPLRHYAEVHLLLSPGEKGSGITFDSKCSLDALSSNWQNLVQTHVLEKRHRGVLLGAPLTDVKITLLSGKNHIKHTEGGDFREATYRAIRHGLMYAKSQLLEPWYEFCISADFSSIGRVQSDLQRMGAESQAPREEEGIMCIRGRAPVRLMKEYPATLTAFTKGRGRISLSFGGYEPCRDEKRIVEAAGYEPDRDLENTPDSVFCSHGAGYPVKWYDAAGHMHLEVEQA